MAILNDVKAALRISSTAYDTAEIQPLIDAARADLILCGVLDTKAADDTDPLINRAIVTYVKANFGYNNPDADRLQFCYEAIRNHLTMSIEYGGDTVVI